MLLTPSTAMELLPILTLTCCCCGNDCKGRQWHNRDTGYGLCDECQVYCASRMDTKEMHECYGIAGVHHSLGATKGGAK